MKRGLMMRVVGRDADLAHVERALDEVGRGFAAGIISGDPGIGKTTVWRHGTATARARGYQLVQCRPAESETWLSFSGLTDLMADVSAPVLDALPGPQREALEVALLKREAPRSGTGHRAVLTAVTSVVHRLATISPVVIAVDDLQWLDVSTAQILAYVLRRVRGEPVLLLATASSVSPGEPFSTPVGPEGTTATTWNSAEQPLLAELDQILSSDRILRIRLGPLSPPELRELLRERTAAALTWPELLRLHEVSGGNPLFAVEITRALDRSHTRLVPGEPLPVPPSIANLVAERVRTLPGPTRTALLIASALAHPTIGQIRTALNTEGSQPPDTADALLEGAEHHDIVGMRNGAVYFTHPMLAAAIYSCAEIGQRRAVHRRLAEVVRDDEEERAWHMALAVHGPDREVAAALEKAARAAHARGAEPAAATLWELAGRQTPATDPDAAAERTIAAAECLFLMGDAGRARSMLEAVTTAMTAGRQRAGAFLALATVLYYQQGSAAAATLCRRALSEAGGDRLLRARLHLRAAWFGEHQTCARVAHAEAAVAILAAGDVTADPDLLARTRLARGYYTFLAGHGIALDDLARARCAQSSYNRSWEWAWGQSIAIQWTKCLNLRDAEACCVQLLAREDRGDEPGVAHTLFHLAEIECWLGRLREAKEHGDAAAACFRHTGQQRWGGLACYIQALPAAYLGELETARMTATRGLEISTPDDDPHAAALNLGLLGFVSLTLGELAAADRYLSRADELVAGMGLAEPAMHRFHGDYLETMLARGELVRAADLQRRLEDRVRVAAYPWLAMITARGRASLRATEGDLDAAVDAAAHALGEARDAAVPVEYARTWLTMGRIRRRRREKLLAREAFQQARDIFDTLPNEPWSEQATAEIRRLGARSASRHELTSTEDRVARLAATGLTNREIAGAVHISEKTVEAHLSRVFRKLGIRSRRELTHSPALRDGHDEGN